MPIAAGALTDRITLQRYDTATATYSTISTDPRPWAAVQSDGEERYRFQLRYRGDLFGFKDTHPAMRVLYGDRVLDIVDVAETERRATITVTAQGRQIETTDLAGGARRTQAWPS